MAHQCSTTHGHNRILKPLSANVLNSIGIRTPTSRKRKRGEGESPRSVWESFTIKAHPSTPFDVPRVLTPLLLLPRANFSLGYLDTNTISSGMPSTRLFAGDIKCFGASEPGSGERAAPAAVLIARLEKSGLLYAIERIREGIYALCKLGSWVTLKELRAAASVVCDDTSVAAGKELPVSSGCNWWESAALSVPGKFIPVKRQKLGNGADVRIMVTCPARPPQTGTPAPLNTTIPVQIQDESVLDASWAPSSGVEDAQKLDKADDSTVDPFQMIRAQYLESLYISKASLAYFPKGPLSKARTHFHNTNNTSATVSNLIAFLQGSILPLNKLDKKYRETIPDVVQLLPPGDVSDSESSLSKHAGTNTKKKRKSKSTKLGKDGLYVQERDYVAKWWRSSGDYGVQESPHSTREAVMKKRIVCLRIRETKLQIILILEVLALQATSALATPNCEVGTTAPLQSQSGGKAARKASRSKKAQDLGLTLELLVDRLCIWQSVDHEEPGLFASLSSFGETQSAETGSRSRPDIPGQHGHDDLRDFCVEVVIPFYAARLPERCAAISPKLGGPSLSSPKRAPSRKSSKPSISAGQPGAPTKRLAAMRPQRGFERIVSDGRMTRAPSQRASLQPSLTRSATAPLLTNIKREASEAPLSAIPLHGSQSIGVQHRGLLSTNRFSQREVDLSFKPSSTETKLRKDALIKDELKGAITALRKPNRHLAVSDYAEFCEQRRTGLGGKGSQKAPSDPSLRGLQVQATPRGPRQTRVLLASAPLSPGGGATAAALEVPSVLGPCIPSSAVRPPPAHSLSRSQTLPAIHETPSRRPINVFARTASDIPHHQLGCNDNEVIVSTPTVSRIGLFKPLTPTPMMKENQSIPSQMFCNTMPETPCRRASKAGLVSLHPGKGSGARGVSVPLAGRGVKPFSLTPTKDRDEEAGVSIYKSLGWDEGDDSV